MIAVKLRFSSGIRRRLANRLRRPQFADRSAALFYDFLEAVQKFIANSIAIAVQGLGNDQSLGIVMMADHFDGTGIDGIYEERGGSQVAYQVKYRKNHNLTFAEVAPFLGITVKFSRRNILHD